MVIPAVGTTLPLGKRTCSEYPSRVPSALFHATTPSAPLAAAISTFSPYEQTPRLIRATEPARDSGKSAFVMSALLKKCGIIQTYLFTAEVRNSDQGTSYVATRSQGDGKSFNGVVVGDERGIVTDVERHILGVDIVVVGKGLKLPFDVFHSGFVTRASNDTVLAWRAVCDLLEDLSLGEQVVNVERVAESLLLYMSDLEET